VDPDKLTEAERAVWKAFPRGGLVDLTKARSRRARTIRAEVIASLLLGAVQEEPGRIAAIHLHGALITGPLSLGHATITGPTRLENCEFDAPIDLSGAKAREFDLEGSRLAGIFAPRAEVDGNLSLVGCECVGQVYLVGAHITGALRMKEFRLTNPGDVALLGTRLVIDDDLRAQRATVSGEFRLLTAQVGGQVILDGATFQNEGGKALNGAHLSVAASMSARDFQAVGEVDLSDAGIGHELRFEMAALSNPGGYALRAVGVTTGSTLFLHEGFAAAGAIWLSRARIGAEIWLSNARVANPDAIAIRCRNAQATTLVLGPGLEVEGIADFRLSKFPIIRDDQASWPRRMRLSGLSYDALEPPLSIDQRVQWLRKDIDGFVPENYETLAATYRNHGDDASARRVLLARERERREHLPWYRRTWSWLQEMTVGYGYLPLRAGIWLAAFLALGTLVFGLHHPPSLAGAPHPAFNPFIYSLDLLIPFVGLGLRNAYDPQGPQRWLAYFLIAVGWIFVTTIATGIARVLRRQ
jgi:hypothetical protein